MSELTTLESKADTLVALPTTGLQEIYSKEGALDPFVERVEHEARRLLSEAGDASTGIGRSSIKSIAYKVTRSKTLLDDTGKIIVAELKDLPKKIDANRKKMRDTLEALAEEIRRPVTEWETREKARVEQHAINIDDIASTGTVAGFNCTSEHIKACIDKLELYGLDRCEEFEDDYRRAIAAAIASLKTELPLAQKREADAKELEELRAAAALQRQKDRDAEIAKAAVEQANKAAEDQRQRELKAISDREAEAKRATDEANAKIAQAEADKAKAIEDERARAVREQQRQLQEDEIRAENKRRRGQINRAIVDALKDKLAFTDPVAKEIVTMIAKGEIPHLQINY